MVLNAIDWDVGVVAWALHVTRERGGGQCTGTDLLGGHAGLLQQLVHGLEEHHLALLQRRVPAEAHGLLDDACTKT
jgi:hypothetical protein